MIVRRLPHLVTIIFALLSAKFNYAQLQITTGNTAQWFVQNVLAGAGVQVSNVTFTGDLQQMGEFTDGNLTNLGMDQGFIMSVGKATEIASPNNSTAWGFDFNSNGTDPDLAQLVTGNQHDITILEFDFVPQGDKLSLDFIWGSEEYPEYVDQSYNDVFGFFLSGPGIAGPYTNNAINIATVPGGGGVVSIDNVNNVNGSNTPWYIDNTGGTSIQFDGFTQPIPVSVDVQACETYHIKMALSDLGDGVYDSGIFLKRHSFSSNQLGVNTSYDNTLTDQAIEGCASGKFIIGLPNPVSADSTIHYSIGGTAINGIDYQTISTSVIIPAGQDFVEIVIVPLADTLVEGPETVELTFNYVDACTGIDVVASININEARSFDPGDNKINCGETSIQAYVMGSADYEWYPTATGGTSFATSTGSNLSTTFPVTSMTQVSGTAPNRIYSAFVEDATLVNDTIFPITNEFTFDNNTFRNGYSQETRLYFDVSTPFTLNGLDIRYRTSSNNATLKFNLKNAGGTIIKDTTITTLPNTNGNPQTVSLTHLDFDIPIGTGYYIDIEGSTDFEMSWIQNGPAGWAPYSINIGTGSVGSIQGNQIGWAPDGAPYYFNWDISAKANSDVCGRVEVLIPETCLCSAPTTVEVTSTPSSVCEGESITLNTTYTLGSSQNGGYRYTWYKNETVVGTANSITYSPLSIGNTDLTDATEYKLRIEDGDAGSSACYLEDSIDVTINAIPDPPNVTHITYCQGETAVALTATGTNLKWFSASTGGNAFTSPPIPSTHVAGVTSYYVSQTNATGCESARSQLDVTVHALPIAPSISPITYCATVTATPLMATGTSLTWYTNAIGGTALLSTPTPSTIDGSSTSYYVSQTNTEGCEGPRAELSVTIVSLPTLTMGANSSICDGNNSNITFNTTGIGPFNITYHDGTQNININGVSDGHTISASPSSTTTYTASTIEMVNAPKCSGIITSKDTTEIAVNLPPIFTDIIQACDVNLDYTVKAKIEGGNGNYQLIQGNGSIVDDTLFSTTITLDSEQVFEIDDDNGCGPVSFVIADSCVCTSFAGAFNDNSLLNLCTNQKATFVHDDHQVLDENDTFEFILVADTANKSGSLLVRSKIASFAYDETIMTGGTTYYILAVAGDSTSNGEVNLTSFCTDFSPALPVSFTPLPQATISGDSPICEGETTDLTFDVSAFTSFQIGYTENGTSQVFTSHTSTENSKVVQPDTTTLYELDSIYYTSAPTCRVLTNSSVVIEVNDSILFSDSTLICDFTNSTYTINIQLEDGTGQYSLLSSTNGGTFTNGLFTSENIVSGVDYTFVFADENLCNTITITGNEVCPCITESGDLNDETSVTICENSSHSFTHNGNEVLDGNDVLEYILYANVNSPLSSIIDRSSSTLFSFIPTAMEVDKTYYIAAMAGNNNGNNQVDLTSSCIDVSTPQPITFKKLPSLTIKSPNTICAGESTTVTVEGNDISNYSFTYTSGTQTLTTSSVDNTLSLLVQPTETTTYQLESVQYESAPLCTVNLNEATTIEVIEKPTITSISPDIEGCFGESYTIEMIVEPLAHTPVITWMRNNLVYESSTETMLSVKEEGSYYAIVDHKGCVNTSPIVQVDLTNVSITATAEPSHLFSGASSNIAVDGAISYEYTWINESTNETFSGTQHTMTPLETTSYSVIASENNCYDTALVTIHVYNTVSAPYFFSPNGDGTNDTWVVAGLNGYPTTSIHIYNRWGSEVKVLFNQDNEWDGTGKSGRILPDGVYFYVIHASFPGLENEEQISFSGNVTLSH